MQQLVDLLSKPPASFEWATKDGRTLGTSPGFIVDIWPDRVELTALFPPDDAALAARNGTIIQLILMALRPDWRDPGVWLAETLKLAHGYAPTAERPIFDLTYSAQQMRFTWDRRVSRVAMQVKR